MRNTFITVIVPVYNIEEYIERCVRSILNQTYDNFELLLVDDGSKDRSGEIIDEIAKTDSRIKVFHKENGGSSSARNLAIENASGEYFSFIDSDDYIEPDFLECLVAPVNRAKEAGENIPKIVQIGRNEIDEAGNIQPDICTPPDKEEFISSEQFFKDLIMHIGDCSFCTKITHRDLFKERAFPVGKLNEDFHLLIYMLNECSGVVNLPGYKYHVFYRIGSNTRKKEKNNFSRVFQDCIDNADEVELIVKDKSEELREIALRFAIFQRIEYMLHIPIAFMNKEYKGYPECVSYLKKHIFKGLKNRYLTRKNKIYLVIFATVPRLARKIHAKIKHL